MWDHAALQGTGGTEPFSRGKKVKYVKSNEVVKYIDDK